jgi:hypothetical protein
MISPNDCVQIRPIWRLFGPPYTPAHADVRAGGITRSTRREMPRAGCCYDHVVDKSSLSLRIASVSLDCGDHEEPARFYADLLQGTLLWIHEKSAAVESDGMVLVMQRVEDYRPPTWPGTSIVHLDLHGGAQIGELERRAIALGACTDAAGLAIASTARSGWPSLLRYPLHPVSERPVMPI